MANSQSSLRRFNKHWRVHIRKLSRIVGEITLAANLLQATLGGIFWKLIDIKEVPDFGDSTFEELDVLIEKYSVPAAQVFGIWNAISSDSTQREMMLASAEAIFDEDSRLLGRIKWIKRKADSLGTIRNDAAHLVLDFEFDPAGPGRLIPAPFGMPDKRVKRLQDAKTLERRFQYVAGDFIALQTYAYAVLLQMADPMNTLPKRPKLRSVPDQR